MIRLVIPALATAVLAVSAIALPLHQTQTQGRATAPQPDTAPAASDTTVDATQAGSDTASQRPAPVVSQRSASVVTRSGGTAAGPAAPPSPVMSAQPSPAPRSSGGSAGVSVSRAPAGPRSPAGITRSVTSSVSPEEQRVLQLAQSIRSGEGDDADRMRLKDLVASALDQRLASQREELDRLRKKLKELEQALAERERLRERIIARRVEELIDPAVDWDQVRGHWAPTSGFSGPPRTGTPIGIAGPAVVAGGTSSGQPSVLVTRPAPDGAAAVDGPGPGVLAPEPTPDAAQVASGRIASAPTSDTAANAVDWITRLSAQHAAMEQLEAPARMAIGSGLPEAVQPWTRRVQQQLDQWRAVWNAYEAAVRGRQLEVEEQSARLAAAEAALDVVEENFAIGLIRNSELQEKRSAVQIAEIRLERARDALRQLESIASDAPHLDPRNYTPPGATATDVSDSAADDTAAGPDQPNVPQGDDSAARSTVTPRPRETPAAVATSEPRDAQAPPADTPPRNRDADSGDIPSWREVVSLLETARNAANAPKAHFRIRVEQLHGQLTLLKDKVAAAEDFDATKDGSAARKLRAEIDVLQQQRQKLLESLERYNAGGPPTQWQQAWSFYEHALTMLKLELQKQQISFEAKSAELERLETLYQRNVVSQAELTAIRSDVSLAEVRLTQARERLAFYANIASERPELNPQSWKPFDLPEQLPSLPDDLRKMIEQSGNDPDRSDLPDAPDDNDTSDAADENDENDGVDSPISDRDEDAARDPVDAPTDDTLPRAG